MEADLNYVQLYMIGDLCRMVDFYLHVRLFHCLVQLYNGKLPLATQSNSI